MAKLNFETLSFQKVVCNSDKTKGLNLSNNLNDSEDCQDYLKVTLLKIFNSKISFEKLEKYLGKFELIGSHTLEFPHLKQEKAELLFSQLLAESFDDLRNSLTGNKTFYLHRNSGVPLIGNVAFGIVYRDSSIIEIKPITSCNLNCMYCSVSEGLNSDKKDFVVEKEYMVEELTKLLNFIKEDVEVHIGVQGEPFLYADMEELISDIQQMKKVSCVSIDTNGTLLTKNILDRLGKNDKLRINFSLDAIEPELAKKMAGVENYNVKHVTEMIKYASEKVKVLVAPIIVPGFNEQEMEKIIKFVKDLPNEPILGIQNFLNYKTGRNPCRAWPWKKFYSFLTDLGEENGYKLKLCKEDFGIHKTKELPKPFHLGDVITAKLMIEDRFNNSCVAVAGGRNISVPNCPFREGKKVKLKISRDKHNVFTGKLVGK